MENTSNNNPAPAAPEAKVNDAQTQETAAQKERRMLKAKVNGREELVSEEALVRDYQKYKAADQRLAEASAKQKEIARFYQDLENDPETALAKSNLPAEKKRQLAEKWLMEQLEDQLRDPREREMMELRQQLEQFQSKERETKEETERRAFEAQRAQAIQERQAQLQQTFQKALEISPLSKDPDVAAETLRAMAQHYRLAKSQGYTPDPAELAQVVEERELRKLGYAASSLSGADLVKVLGRDVIKKLREYDLSQWDQKNSAAPQPQEWQPREEVGGRKEKTSLEDFQRSLRKGR